MVQKKITVAVGFLTQIIVTQNSNTVSRVLRRLLKSTVSNRCCLHHCLKRYTYSQLSFLSIMCVFLIESFSSWFHQNITQAVGPQTLGWHCCRQNLSTRPQAVLFCTCHTSFLCHWHGHCCSLTWARGLIQMTSNTLF